MKSVEQVRDFSAWLLSKQSNFASIFNDQNSSDQHYRTLGVIYSAGGLICNLLNAEIALLTDLGLRTRELEILNSIDVIITACTAQLLTLGPQSTQLMCAVANEHPTVAYALSELGRVE